jgi:tryptophan synthase alpha chain
MRTEGSLSMSAIDQAFARLKAENRKGIIPFIVAGDPDLRTTRDILIELGRAGATLIELGVPFSDPMADGPVIQRASERALKSSFGLQEVLSIAAEVRQVSSVPIVLFSYLNPLLQYGFERLAREARLAGIDGVLVTDLAPEEADDFAATLRANGLDMIFLVAPTSSSARLQMISEKASGFIYAVSRLGVTGAQNDLSSEAEELVSRVRTLTDLPIAVGFGISNAEQVANVWQYADAAVVGSAIVAEIERLPKKRNLEGHVGSFFRSLIPGIH